MITNEHQAGVTRKQIENFKRALKNIGPLNGDLDIMGQAERDGISSQLEDLQKELKDFEILTKATRVTIETLADIADGLIRARIASRLSQRELANRAGLKVQAIQRYESQRYKGASLERLAQIATAMGVNFSAIIGISKH